MARLDTFPTQGWCNIPSKLLGKYLAKRYKVEYEPPGYNGYAWNTGSYWTIETASGKTPYGYTELKHLLNDPIEESDIHVAVRTKKPKEILDDIEIKNGFVQKDIIVRDYVNPNLCDKIEDLKKEGVDLGAYPIPPDECYTRPLKVNPRDVRNTKRNKYFLKKSIRGYVDEFINNPCREVYIDNSVDTSLGGFNLKTPLHWSSMSGDTKGRRSAVFNPIAIELRIKELRRRKRLLRRI